MWLCRVLYIVAVFCPCLSCGFCLALGSACEVCMSWPIYISLFGVVYILASFSSLLILASCVAMGDYSMQGMNNLRGRLDHFILGELKST